MPYTDIYDKSLPANVKAMTNRQKRQWINVWNSVYKSCQKSGGADCEGKAFAQANGVLKEQMESMAEIAEAVTKSEKDGSHPSSHYLVVPDEEKPSTWALRVKDMQGSPDHRLMGAAMAALTVGYRGNKYEGPDKGAALAKLKKMYKSEDMPMPGMEESAASDRDTEQVEAMAECGPTYQTKMLVPNGVTTFVDLEAANAVYEATEEMNERVSQFQQLAWNIFYSPDITDKVGALRSLVDEFAGLMGDATASVSGGELAEAATVKARVKAAINSLSALVGDKSIPKALGEQIESLRSAFRKNWSDLETEAQDEKDGTASAEAAVSEQLFESASTLTLAESESNGPLLVDVALIRAGWGNERDNHYYPKAVLEAAGPLFVDAKMYETDHRPNEKSTRTWVSTVKEVRGVAADGSLMARVAIHDPNFAQRVRNLAETDSLSLMENSILADGMAKPGYSENGRKGKLIESFTRVESVDWVTRAGAGGRITALAENDRGATMDPKKNEEPKTEPVAEADPKTEPVKVRENEKPETTRAEEAQKPEPVKFMESAAAASLLEKSGLPELAVKRLALGRYADETALTAAIAAEKEYVKALTASGKPFGLGGSTVAAEKNAEQVYQERVSEIGKRYGLNWGKDGKA